MFGFFRPLWRGFGPTEGFYLLLITYYSLLQPEGLGGVNSRGESDWIISRFLLTDSFNGGNLPKAIT